MEKTPQAAKALSAIMNLLSWDQGKLSEASGIARSTVSFHVNGERPVRDNHLAEYCQGLPALEQCLLVAAWLRDALSAEVQANIFEGHSVLAASIRAYAPSLDDETRKMLDWLSSRLSTDQELAEVFRIVCRRAGYSQE